MQDAATDYPYCSKLPLQPRIEAVFYKGSVLSALIVLMLFSFFGM